LRFVILKQADSSCVYMGIKSVCAGIMLLFLLGGCGGEVTYRPSAQVMVASWYGKDFHGRPTASGEIFNMYDYTAAHKTLPFGSRLKIINPKNGRSVVVRVNDRGPFVPGRDIDLSYAAARKIGIISEGTARVYVQYLGRDPVYVKEVKYSVTEGPFTIQVASFKELENAYRLKRILEYSYRNVYIQKRWIRGERFYRVRIGRFYEIERARAVAKKLASEGYEVIIMSYEEIL